MTIAAERFGEVEYSVRSLLEWSLGFEGDALSVLVDELQFLCCSPYVVVSVEGRERRSVLEGEHEAIVQAAVEGSRELLAEFGSLSIFRESVGLAGDGAETMSRRVLQSISTVLSFRGEELAGRTIVVRLGFASVDRNELAALTGRPFAEFLQRVVGYAVGYSAKGNGLDVGDFNIDTVHNRFRHSRYLEAALGWMHKKIVEVISSMGPTFARDAHSPFFVNYFLSATDASAPPHTLRFFPLQTQIEILGSHRVRENVEREAAQYGLDVPKDVVRFIRDYKWDAQRSFAGYVSDTGASLYAEQWQTEPLVKGDRLPPAEQHERRVAMLVLQAAREWPSNLLEIPLTVGPHLFGVAHVNVKEPIDKDSLILPVRSLRDSGFLLRMALRSDEEANHVASLSAYKHCMQSVMHHEGRYTKFMGGLIFGLTDVALPESVKQQTTLASAIVREREQVYEEFHLQKDPLISVPPEKVYRSKTHAMDIRAMPSQIRELYGERAASDVSVDLALTVPDVIEPLDPRVVYRILRELLWNSFSHGRRVEVPSLRVVVDYVSEGARSLVIIVEDNFGGFADDDDMPHEITFESWSEFVHRRSLLHGMGFFTLARYARATGGSCSRENYVGADGRVGSRVTVRLGLR